MNKFFREFKKFAMQGNVIDLAVGVMIGSAFSAVVTSLVNNIISPLIGLLVQVDFSALAFTIRGVNIGYGAFIMAILNFVIVAFCLFLLVKSFNKLSFFKHKKEADSAPKTKICPYCKSEINIDATRCPECTSHFLQ